MARMNFTTSQLIKGTGFALAAYSPNGVLDASKQKPAACLSCGANDRRVRADGLKVCSYCRTPE